MSSKGVLRCPRCNRKGAWLREGLFDTVESTCPKTAMTLSRYMAASHRESRAIHHGTSWVFCDGSSTGSFAAIVVAGFFTCEQVVHGPRVATANVGAELLGVALGLYLLPSSAKQVTVVSDFANTAPWAGGVWRVQQPEVLERLRLIRRLILTRGYRVQFVHHRGHQRDDSDFTRYNNRADELCSSRNPKRRSKRKRKP